MNLFASLHAINLIALGVIALCETLGLVTAVDSMGSHRNCLQWSTARYL